MCVVVFCIFYRGLGASRLNNSMHDSQCSRSVSVYYTPLRAESTHRNLSTPICWLLIYLKRCLYRALPPRRFFGGFFVYLYTRQEFLVCHFLILWKRRGEVPYCCWKYVQRERYGSAWIMQPCNEIEWRQYQRAWRMRSERKSSKELGGGGLQEDFFFSRVSIFLNRRVYFIRL